MPVRRSSRSTKSARPKRRAKVSRVSAAKFEEMIEERAEAIVHKHNLFDLKMAFALAVIGLASMAVTALASANAGLSTAAAVTSTAQLIISPTQDTTTVPRIVMPSTAAVQVAKWNVTAGSEPVTLKTAVFAALNPDYSVRTTVSEFDEYTLMSGDGNILAQTKPLTGSNNGYVLFNNVNLNIPANQSQTLSLRATIASSGRMKPNSMIRFGVPTNVLHRWSVVATNSGTSVSAKNLTLQPISYTAGAPTVLNLYHNAAPIIMANQLDGTLDMSAEEPIFRFTVTNPGDRDLRFSKFLINTTVTGLANYAPPTSTGYISEFKIFAANASGNIGQHIASASNCLVSPMPNGPKTGTLYLYTLGTSCSLGGAALSFDQQNDVNNALDSLVIPVGSSQTFIVTANTTNSLVGKTPGSSPISISAKISGTTGPFPSADPKKPVWGTGGLFYHYTPVAGKENATPYTHSDSYPVLGTPLVRGF